MIRIKSRTGFSLGSSGAAAKGESDMMKSIHELAESGLRRDDSSGAFSVDSVYFIDQNMDCVLHFGEPEIGRDASVFGGVTQAWQQGSRHFAGSETLIIFPQTEYSRFSVHNHIDEDIIGSYHHNTDSKCLPLSSPHHMLP